MGRDRRGQADVGGDGQEHQRRLPDALALDQGLQARDIDGAEQRGQDDQPQGVGHGPQQPVGQGVDVVDQPQPVAAEAGADQGCDDGDAAEDQDVARAVEADPAAQHAQGAGRADEALGRIGHRQPDHRAGAVAHG